jgi:hypothetical protein
MRASRLVGIVLFLLLVAPGNPLPTSAQPRQAAPSLQGQWRNADSIIQITVNKEEIEGRFTQVGPAAAGLGFKVGEVSLKGSQRGEFLFGEQTIRYGGTQACFKDGRKVPFIGRVTPDGQVLAFHNYNVFVGPDCRDTGAYQVLETLWQRVPR